MSKATKRKHVTREVLEDYILPEEKQQILKVVGGRGNNLHEAQTSEGDQFLISMPTRFRKNVWIKRGDFVLVDPIPEGGKVKAEIVAILYPKQIKYIKEEGLWPKGFNGGLPLNSSEKIRGPSEDDVVDVTKILQETSLSGNDNKTEGDADNRHGDGSEEEEEYDYSSEDNDDDLFVNTNRPTVTYFYSDSSDEEEEEEEEEEGGENEKEEGGGLNEISEDHDADR